MAPIVGPSPHRLSCSGWCGTNGAGLGWSGSSVGAGLDPWGTGGNGGVGGTIEGGVVEYGGRNSSSSLDLYFPYCWETSGHIF